MHRDSTMARDRGAGRACGGRLHDRVRRPAGPFTRRRAPVAAPPSRPRRPPAASASTTGAVAGTLTITAFDLGFKPAAAVRAGRRPLRGHPRQHRRHRARPHVPGRHADRGRRRRDRHGRGRRPRGGPHLPVLDPGARGGRDAGRDHGRRRHGRDDGPAVRGPGRRGGRGSAAAAPAAAPVPDPNAPAYVLHDARAPEVMDGRVHDIDMPIIETDVTVAEGFVVHAWTFGGTVPGPTIRVHLGDTVNVHLTNRGSMSHSIDFHASQTAMNHQMVEIKPGETFTYTFTADYAGVWMYHCGTAPALHHIANGMYGMVIVEPKGGLPKVDDEFAFVQSEWYLGAQGEPADYAKANQTAAAPDFVVFNGVANQYKDHPVPVTTKGRTRVFVLDAGPNVDSSFHVVGTIFDTVIKEGVGVQRGNAGGWGSQAVDLAPAQGAIIEFSPRRGRDVSVRHPRLQPGHARRDRDLLGRRRRPDELTQGTR